MSGPSGTQRQTTPGTSQSRQPAPQKLSLGATSAVIVKNFAVCLSNSSSEIWPNIHFFYPAGSGLLSAAERRGTPVLLSASVSDNSGNSPKVAAPRMPRETDQSTQRFHVGYHWQPIRCGDTKCLVSLSALCCHLWRDINNNTNRGRVLGKVSCTKNLLLGE